MVKRIQVPESAIELCHSIARFGVELEDAESDKEKIDLIKKTRNEAARLRDKLAEVVRQAGGGQQ